jgi:hypothetical protein
MFFSQCRGGKRQTLGYPSTEAPSFCDFSLLGGDLALSQERTELTAHPTDLLPNSKQVAGRTVPGTLVRIAPRSPRPPPPSRPHLLRGRECRAQWVQSHSECLTGAKCFSWSPTEALGPNAPGQRTGPPWCSHRSQLLLADGTPSGPASRPGPKFRALDNDRCLKEAKSLLEKEDMVRGLCPNQPRD